MSLRILRLLIENGALTAKDLAKRAGITDRAVRYHLGKLIRLGLVDKSCSGATCPYVVYSVHLAGGSEILDALSTWGCRLRAREFAVYSLLLREGPLKPLDVVERLPIGRRGLARVVGKLESLGVVVRVGGRRCPHAYLMALVKPLSLRLRHRHFEGSGHRYKLHSRGLTF